jgi:hypothetical protein
MRLKKKERPTVDEGYDLDDDFVLLPPRRAPSLPFLVVMLSCRVALLAFSGVVELC